MDLNKELEKNKRSEEVSDIIERMPQHFGRWVTILVISLVSLLFLFGFIIKYPDIISGQIEINAKYAPVKLISNASGKLTLFSIKTQDKVKEGEYIAYIQNQANIEDVKEINTLIKQFDIKSKQFFGRTKEFPLKVSLGELNTKYYSFMNELQLICRMEKNNTFHKKEENFIQFIEKQKEILAQNLKNKEIKKEILMISEKSFQRDSSMLRAFPTMAVSEDEFERTKMTWLNSKENYQNLCKEISSIQLQIIDAQNKLEQNRIENENSDSQMYLDLLLAYNDLTDNIKLWEQKYVFKAPFNGRVDFMQFWTNDQFLQAGEEVFTIIPEENSILGRVQLPSTGAGKIKIGCEVIIKLADFPYHEYGSIKGIVKSISLTTSTQKTNQGSIETYLVLVELPKELTTNYGSKLEFKYLIKGTADIIANDRRLIERLFDNLKYSLNN